MTKDSHGDYQPTLESMEQDFIDAAISANAGKMPVWRLKNELAEMPADWKPIRRGVGVSHLVCSFWDNEEFLSFVTHSRVRTAR